MLFIYFIVLLSLFSFYHDSENEPCWVWHGLKCLIFLGNQIIQQQQLVRAQIFRYLSWQAEIDISEINAFMIFAEKTPKNWGLPWLKMVNILFKSQFVKNNLTNLTAISMIASRGLL